MSRRNFFKKAPALSTLLLLECLAFFLVSVQIQVEPRLSLLEKIGLTIISPFQHVAHETSDWFGDVFRRSRENEVLEKENEQLREQLEDALMTKTQLQESQLRLQRLEKLFELKSQMDWATIPAEIVGRSDRFGDRMLLINKGTWHGIQVEQGVVCPEGVVGIIWEASPFYSKVLTVNSPGSAVGALLEDSRYLEGYVQGSMDRFGRLVNIPNFIHVQPGGVVLTSGMDGIFPKGTILGHVIKAEKTTQMFQNIDIQFTTSFPQLEEILVMVPPTSEEAGK